MDMSDTNLHVVFIPFLAPGHIIPLTQLAKLFAARGVRCTIITTIHNTHMIKTNEIDSGYPLTVHTISFPAADVGLPVGIENISDCVNAEMTTALIHGMDLLHAPMEQLIRDENPDCIFSDMFITWTVDLAEELKIPSLLFYPTSFLCRTVSHSLEVYAPHANVKSESESFLVPNLPDNITIKRSQVAKRLMPTNPMGDMVEKLQQAEKRSYGLVHNTFYEIEPAYADHIKKIKCPKILHVGPLFQFFKHHNSNSHDRNNGSTWSWLDDQKPKSLIYVCFGSMVRFPEAQITEIALALEESKQGFVWVVRKDGDKENIRGLPEGFEERIGRKKKGLIITGWAPQMEILLHPAVGGFLTHCGWSSVLEAVTAGVPLITWPLFADQFYNEKLVELLGIGVGIGADVWNPSSVITSPLIRKQRILDAIDLLATSSAMVERIRQNSKELSVKAKKAVEEGGSSLNAINTLTDELKGVKLNSKPSV